MSAAQEELHYQLQVMNDEREERACEAIAGYYAHVAWGIKVGDMKDVEDACSFLGLDMALVREKALRMAHGRKM